VNPPRVPAEAPDYAVAFLISLIRGALFHPTMVVACSVIVAGITSFPQGRTPMIVLPIREASEIS